MNVLRISNFYLVRKSIYPEFAMCSTFYKIDRAVNRKMRTSTSDYYFDKKHIKYFNHQMQIERNVHLTPKQRSLMDDIPTQILSIFRNTRMEDMKQAPQPVFWYSTAAILPFLGTPLSFIIFGYSPLLATIQLAFGATLCSFTGGMKWGYALHGTEHEMSWENLGWAIVPQMIGWLGVLVPQTLGFLLVTGGIALSTFIDLTATNYPSWFKAIRLALTVPAIIGLMFTFILRLFH